MRVLHLTPELPCQNAGGGRAHEYFMCRRLVERGHPVLNVSPALPTEVDRADDLRRVGVENWLARRPVSPVREAFKALATEPEVVRTALAAPIRMLEMRVFLTEMRHLINLAVHDWKPDVAIIGHDMAAGWAAALDGRVPAVLTLHNLTWRWYLSRARRATAPNSWILRAEAARYRRCVHRLLGQYFEAATAVSTIEVEELRSATRVPVHLLPIAVDPDEMRPRPEPPPIPRRLLFTGTLNYRPNVEGISWFTKQVWPRVRLVLPDVELQIAGRNPSAEVRALHGRDGIEVVGPVPRMDGYLAGAHAVIVPILTGAGTRVKILEAMAAGRPLVTTTLGCEGLPYVVPGRDFLVADEPAAFARATTKLLVEPELRRTLAARSREIVERRFNWRGLGDEYEGLLTGIVEASAHGTRQ